jgi:hypothetical protein
VAAEGEKFTGEIAGKCTGFGGIKTLKGAA